MMVTMVREKVRVGKVGGRGKVRGMVGEEVGLGWGGRWVGREMGWEGDGFGMKMGFGEMGSGRETTLGIEMADGLGGTHTVEDWSAHRHTDT